MLSFKSPVIFIPILSNGPAPAEKSDFFTRLKK
jgi:hypothetical protein